MDKPLTRTARLLDIVPFILSHQGIAVSELAKEFGVTENEIAADLELVFMCGLPQYTDLELIDLSFESGSVTVREPQNLDKPRRLNGEELSILVMGLDVLKGQLQDPIKVEKISELQHRLKALLQNISGANVLYVDERDLPFLSIINDAIRSNERLEITYLNISKDEVTSRKISPIEVFQQGDEFLLLTWCYKSKANRTFAISRILSCAKFDNLSITKEDVIAEGELEDSDAIEITFKYDRAALSFIEAVKERLTQHDEVGRVAVIEVWDSEWMLRNVMANSSHITILEPKALSIAISNRAKLALSNY
ncbi:MAG: WYL domain-containing protein [Actinomycetes bacterium]